MVRSGFEVCAASLTMFIDDASRFQLYRGYRLEELSESFLVKLVLKHLEDLSFSELGLQKLQIVGISHLGWLT